MAMGTVLPSDGVSRLTTLPSLHQDTIFAALRDCFFNNATYTSISDSVLLSVNPFASSSNRNSDETLREYTRQYRATQAQGRGLRLPPHIFQLACDAYFYMQRTGQDQSVLLTGETSSGKTESRRLAIRTLISLGAAAPGKKASKLATQIPSADFILECMGNARSGENSNASRFGRYTELQFSESGKLIGSKTLDYYLERSRLAAAAGGDGTFHILYAMVAGMSANEKQHLRLGDSSDFRYLGGSRQKAAMTDDAHRFTRLQSAFRGANFSQRQVASICQLLAAVLHLGNLEFHMDPHRSQQAVTSRTRDTLAIVSTFLGIDDGALEQSLSYRTKMIREEVCTIVLDSEGVSTNRDDLAKTLYSLLFTWLNEQLNERMCRHDFDTFIGILDFPGPRVSSRVNSFDEFCVNFANERLHRWTLAAVFEKKQAEYKDEGINHLTPEIPFFDNAECLRLIINQPGGLVHIMDDQARRMPKKSNQTMIDAFGRRWGNHADFRVGTADRSGFPTFHVAHFHGTVSYSVEAWLEKNAEAVNPEFIALLTAGPGTTTTAANSTQNSVRGGSSIPFVRSLFKTTAIKTQFHPKSDQTVVAAQQSVKPVRAPSTKRPNRPGTIQRSTSVRKIGEGAQVLAYDFTDERENDDEDGAERKKTYSDAQCAAGELRAALETLFDVLDETKPWHVLCLRPNDNQLPNQFDAKLVKQQLNSYCIVEMTRKLVNEYSVGMTYEEFCERYATILSLSPVQMQGATSGLARQKFYDAKEVMNWTDRDAAGGRVKVFLANEAFRELEDELRSADAEEQRLNEKRSLLDAEASARGDKDPFSPFGWNAMLSNAVADRSHDSAALLPYDNFSHESAAAMPFAGAAYTPMTTADDKSEWLSPAYAGRSFEALSRPGSMVTSETYAPSRNMFDDGVGSVLADDNARACGTYGPSSKGQVAEKLPESSARRLWVRITLMLTFYVPSLLLSAWGNLKRPDIRMAWREKLAINMMIWFVCAAAVFVVAVLGDLICPMEHVYSRNEVAAHSLKDNAFTSIRGEVFDLTKLLTFHRAVVSVVSEDVVLSYAGQDSTSIFPVQVNALCNGINGAISPWVQLSGVNNTDSNAVYHDFRTFHVDDVRPDWYYESLWLLRSNYRLGFVGYTSSEVSDLLTDGSIVAEIDGGIYDVTDYVKQGNRGVIQAPAGFQAPADTNTVFMSPAIMQLFMSSGGKDITQQLNGLPLSADVLKAQKTCLRNLFFVGKKDTRNSAQCQFSRYILLALSIFMVSIIGFKFLAALQFSRTRTPEDHDRFVICQVPCYTEGEESMRKTIDSLAALKYDDKRKLLFIVCDGMIIGSGNDRPTPRIVLDILGADPDLDSEALSFLSVGDGSKQHNMAKVYSGLYEFSGHVVPYLVVVKVGKPTERSRPGNRGKRDSQLILMRFLNHVHFGTAMNPLQLEIYHQIKNIIGVNPSFYEYILQVDADTEVDQWCLAHFVSAFINDKKIIGLCGETALSNAKKSFVTMLQVYEYYISHYLAKAFESLFGSVTCLPGCFSMFRIRSPDTQRPLFVANRVVEEYAEHRVDTLHTKNLLSLGEDRYLTTLLLKYFGNHKTMFVRAGKALTAAPEEWSILLSQRRRWINSTVHNLFELMKTPGLCGVCLFSMRFIVFIDLLSTIVAPVTVAYLVYLIVLVAAEGESIPTTSLIMLAAIYGLQAVIFILNRKFEMIGWMIVYIIGIPIWSFFLPLYSFWHMDDFSWGNTRVVTGEAGEKVVVHEEGTFDPLEIPLQTWSDYENELWERQSGRSIGDILASKSSKGGPKYGDGSRSRPDSMYESSIAAGAPLLPRSDGYAHSISSSFVGAGGRGGEWHPSLYHQHSPSSRSATIDPRRSRYSFGGGDVKTPATSVLGVDSNPYQHVLSQGQPSLSMATLPLPSAPSLYGGLDEARSGLSHIGTMYGLPAAAATSIYDESSATVRMSPSTSGHELPTRMLALQHLPMDDVIREDVRQLISSSDLNVATKKTLRAELADKYGVASFGVKKNFVNRTIEDIMAGRL